MTPHALSAMPITFPRERVQEAVRGRRGVARRNHTNLKEASTKFRGSQDYGVSIVVCLRSFEIVIWIVIPGYYSICSRTCYRIITQN